MNVSGYYDFQVYDHKLSVVITDTCSNMQPSREDLITAYFSCGYSYSLIVCFLYLIHGISISLRQLKRVLSQLHLTRRRRISPSTIYQATSLIRVSITAFYIIIMISIAYI